MNKSSRWIAASIAIVIAPITTAGAQEYPTPSSPPARAPVEEQAPPAAEPPRTETPRAAPPPARTAVRGTAIEGTWSGTVTQAAGGAAARTGGQTKYPVIVTISRKTAETDYPDQACGGKLNRIGQSRNYVFFVEVISRGGVDQGGRCPNGAITLTRSGENLGWEWFGVFEGELIVASGTLTRKAQ
jgi:hypothetical protein